MKKNSPKLKCNTAWFKLREARYFLHRTKEPKIWNNDKQFDFHLNAFVNSAGTVIDYVHSDFIFHKVEPRIHWEDWVKARNDNTKIKELIDSHPKRIGIRRFLRQFKDEREKLLRIPLVNYFHFKRNEVTHIRWSASKFSLSTTENGKREVRDRRLEGSIKLAMIQHNDNKPLGMFDYRIPREKQIETLRKLSEKNVRIICKEYLTELSNFIDKFEGNIYLK